MEVQICQLCKEAIANFACLRCLGKSITEWLPSPTREGFKKCNNQFLSTFGYLHSGAEHHLLCSSEGEAVCLYCYLNEAFQWLSSMDKAVAKRFRKLFALGKKKEDFSEIIISHAEPVTENVQEKSEFGICDACGDYSEELRNSGYGWVCEGCRDE